VTNRRLSVSGGCRLRKQWRRDSCHAEAKDGWRESCTFSCLRRDNHTELDNVRSFWIDTGDGACSRHCDQP